MKKSLPIPQKIFNHLKYDPTSSTGLRWFNPTLSQIAVGQEAGFKRFIRKTKKPEAIILGFEKKEYKAHRIIWTFVNGLIGDGMVIDHKDGNPFNNTIENLSIKTQRDNILNSSMASNNTSGETGVYLNYDKRKVPWVKRWTAYWVDVNGKKKTRWFSCARYGEEVAFELAVEARKEAISNLILSGEAYTDRHGKPDANSS